jgi:hypothetical protein
VHDVRTYSKISGWLIWSLAVLLLVSSGITYRLLASHMHVLSLKPVSLPVPLSNFPKQIRNWKGKDLDIPNTTKEYMEKNFADDFLSRRYFNTETQAWADIYIVYCSSRPGGVLGHRPRVCYPSNGWAHESTETSQFISRSGRQVSCLLHRFHRSAPVYNQTVILNFYVLNGRLTADEDDFSGPFGRRPNISGDPARYVAQIQISSILENSIRTMAKDITDLILDFLPDQNGKVRAGEYRNIVEDVVK